MDPLTLISGAKTSLDTAAAIVKTYIGAKEAISEIEQKTKSLELMESIVNAKSNIIELKSALTDKDEEILKLKDELKLQKEIKYEPPLYWHDTAEGREGPYCQKCYDNDGKLIRLQVQDHEHDGSWGCKVCNSYYSTKEYSAYANGISHETSYRTAFP